MQVIIVAVIAATPGIWAAWSQLKTEREKRQSEKEKNNGELHYKERLDDESPDLVAKWQNIADFERKSCDDLRLRLRECSNDRERLLGEMDEWRRWALKLEGQLRLANVIPVKGKPANYKEE
jgi:hypothetical protein